MKELPENWCVQITEENKEILEKYRLSMHCTRKEGNTCLDDDAFNKYLISDNKYSDNMYWGWAKPEEYTLISYEDFQIHVRKQKPKPPEDLSYLIDLFKQQQIT